MSDYTDAAPNVSQLKSETEFKADFPEPAPPPAPLPDPSAQKKAELYAAYVAEYTANGGAVALRRLARTVKVKYSWAVTLDREVRAAIAALYAGPE
jgi:hypothetical protein